MINCSNIPFKKINDKTFKKILKETNVLKNIKSVVYCVGKEEKQGVVYILLNKEMKTSEDAILIDLISSNNFTNSKNKSFKQLLPNRFKSLKGIIKEFKEDLNYNNILICDFEYKNGYEELSLKDNVMLNQIGLIEFDNVNQLDNILNNILSQKQIEINTCKQTILKDYKKFLSLLDDNEIFTQAKMSMLLNEIMVITQNEKYKNPKYATKKIQEIIKKTFGFKAEKDYFNVFSILNKLKVISLISTNDGKTFYKYGREKIETGNEKFEVFVKINKELFKK